ncbi:putative gamma-tubulin complex component GCP4 [Aspergillus melleus]|uniref:putative gamma-tubulin complex component GCP4 n=1 Tax=Aspergillus melleus TaxID=138277 RepID=UPI001E8E6A6D|nr:uncharacterized protein LDX57_007275 [Aspergillus melleus]KAH8429604.1 hypothetical protein LDX57_007275 [Aspergillus melleus]
MLHEVLLSLSGQPSPLFNLSTEENLVAEDTFSLLSPPEKALLTPLARLSRLHASLRTHTARISSSHDSVICRAVSTAISTQHLGAFQKKIIEVERAILLEDSGYVGGYGIVPLSTIVGEFSPWTRRLEWLWEVARFILPEGRHDSCTGASLIDFLRAEAQTGYADIEEMALHLVGAAETAWMRQLSTWLLYGNFPVLGKSDFFIQDESANSGNHSATTSNFILHTKLLPKFVSQQTASSILFIGKTLNLIKAKRSTSTGGFSSGLSTAPVTLHGDHIEYLAALKSPISTSKLSMAIKSIRLSLAQSTVSKLLPLPKILEVLSVLHDFLLLRRGEFATALVSHADRRLQERRRKPEALGPRDKPAGVLRGLAVKEGDVTAALAQTWAELYSLQNEEDPQDDELDLARDLLRLSVNDSKESQQSVEDGVDLGQVSDISNIVFEDLLFPTPTSLSVQVRPPLDLFLSSFDIFTYSKIHSYLLGIRRAQIHLGDLWKRTSLRRSYPSPWGPPRSSTVFGQNKLKMGRQRDNARLHQMRPIWATSSASLFVVSEIGSFFQGEVINGSWQHFRDWIEGRPTSVGSSVGSRPQTAASSKTQESGFEGFGQTATQRHDPETLTIAHRGYLLSIVQSLFLTDVPFTKALRSFLTSVDHFIALVVRLEGIQRNMDLETDEGVVDALVDYAGEEREVWQSLSAARHQVEVGIKNVVARLRDIDDNRSGEGRKMFNAARPHTGLLSAPPQSGTSAESAIDHYVPRKAAGVDRLLMKLDFGNANGSVDGVNMKAQ